MVTNNMLFQARFWFFFVLFCFVLFFNKFIHFKSAKHKAKETLLYCLLNNAEVS